MKTVINQPKNQQYQSAISVILPLAVSIFALPASAATLIVDSAGGGNHTTIQAAVDAAASGDIIQINAHTDSKGYRENVVVSTANLTLRGNSSGAAASEDSQTCPTAVIDGCETAQIPAGCGATQLVVNASDVKIERLTFRHGLIRLDSNGGNAAFSEICVIDPENDAIRTKDSGDGNVRVNGISIDRSVFQGGRSQNIEIISNNASITASFFFAVDDGIKISGSDALISGNTFGTCNDRCIQIVGNNGRIEKNVLLGGDDGIDYDGNNPTITGNRIDSMGDNNIEVNCGDYFDPLTDTTVTQNCTGGTVSDNLILGSGDDDEGISIKGAINFTIENNTIKFASETGLEFKGENSTIRGNRLWRNSSESSSESCMKIYGNGSNTIENNKFNYCTFRSIHQSGGDGNTYRNNTIIGSGRAGIYVESGNNTVIDTNTITGGAGEGIANSSSVTGTIITNNTITGNRTDICNDGGVGTVSGNTSNSGSTATACIIDK